MCRSSTCRADGTLPDPVVAVKVPVTAVNEPLSTSMHSMVSPESERKPPVPQPIASERSTTASWAHYGCGVTDASRIASDASARSNAVDVMTALSTDVSAESRCRARPASISHSPCRRSGLRRNVA